MEPAMAPRHGTVSFSWERFFFQSFGNSFFTERHNEVTPPIEAEYNPGDLIRNLGPSSTYTGSILAEGSSFFFALEQKVGQGPTGLEGLGMKNVSCLVATSPYRLVRHV